MRLVIVTGEGQEHRYVANAICTAYEVDAILLCDVPSSRSPWAILRREPLHLVDKALRVVFLRVIRDQSARKSSLNRVLGPSSEAFTRSDLVEHVGLPREGQLARSVADLAPDVLVIYGTGIIPDNVLSYAGAALNMHTGKSPWYRGVQCAFWPLRDMRPDMVGATVHECTSDVDGGLIYARQTASLQADDDLHAIFARSVEVGARAYVEIVGKALSDSLEGTVQDLSEGQEFRGIQLGIVSELRVRLGHWRLRRAGELKRLPQL